MLNNKNLKLILLLAILHPSCITCLGKYCSSVNRDELIEKFENCTKSKSFEYSAKSELSVIKEKYENILSILDRVLASINDGVSSNKNDTKNLFLDILRLVEIANSHTKLKFCISSICSLFKNCEFPINIEYKNFESDAMVASRLAGLLTAITFNERVDNRTYLTKTNIYSLLRLGIFESENIYDSKIAFFRTPDQDRFMIHASKSLKDKSTFLFYN